LGFMCVCIHGRIQKVLFI